MQDALESSETRAGVRSYTGIYSYDSRGLRIFARRTEGGVLSHEGTYTYDDAGRLTQVTDAATQQTELYTWYADGTLAAYPGPGYTRLLDYDEEGRLLRIRRDHGGGNVQTAYEYAYGHDGKRRWRKDYFTNTWTRYPCGVACGAGDLVEQQSTLAGGTWQTSALCLQGLSLVRRNGEYHHFDVLGTVGVVTDAGGTVLSSDLFDAFGVLRHAQGQAATPWRWQGRKLAEEGLLAACGGAYQLPDRALPLQAKKEKPERPWWHWPPRWPWKPELKPKKPPKPHWPYTGRFDCAPSWLERFGFRLPWLFGQQAVKGFCKRCLFACYDHCAQTYDLMDDARRHDDCQAECWLRYTLCMPSRRF